MANPKPLTTSWGILMADQDHSNDFTVDRTPGQVPSRTDNRTILHTLHDELGKALGIGRAKDAGVVNQDGSHSGLMDAVDQAVSGAPKQANDY